MVVQAERLRARAVLLVPRPVGQIVQPQDQERVASGQLGHARELPRQERGRGNMLTVIVVFCVIFFYIYKLEVVMVALSFCFHYSF